MKHFHTCLNPMGWQDPQRVIHKPLYSGTVAKRNGSNEPKKFVVGSVPLEWCTNICAGAWERQSGCGSDARGR